MKRVLALVFLLLLLLTGCAGTPQSRESGATAVVSVLGVEPAGQGIHLLAAAEGRGEEPFRCDSQGETPAAAVEGLTNRGEQVVSCAHVAHLLLTQNAAGTLPELLSYAFQEPQQSTETQLWVVRADTLEEAFSGEADTAKRMSVIKSQGKNRQGFCPVTLREAAAALARKEPLLLPALEVGEQGLAFAGFALYQEGGITQWLTGPEALGAALLLGDRVHWTGSVEAQAMVLQSTGCRVVPQMEEGRLTGLSIRCRLEGVLTGGWESRPGDVAKLEEETARAMYQAVAVLQRAEADATDLLGRAGLSNPLRWQALSSQWPTAFSTLPVEVSVTITVTERQ